MKDELEYNPNYRHRVVYEPIGRERVKHQDAYDHSIIEEKELQEWQDKNPDLILAAYFLWNRHSHCAGQVLSKRSFLLCLKELIN